jgi:pyrroline-5-carboxylate reductase
MLDGQIGFIGAGQMARALARGFVSRGLAVPNRILAFDPDDAALKQFETDIPQVNVAANNSEVVAQSATVILAVKPQSFPAVIASLESQPTAGRLFLSILAGVSLAKLRQGLKTDRIARVMPNTPCLIGCGAAGYALADPTAEKDGQLVEKLFSSVGIVFSLPEHLLDAVTGLSGSGPAYVYTMIEALSDGGVRMGLPRQVATALAAQTVMGAAQMVLTTGEHPGLLKDRVASPAGTTIAGLQVLERRGIRSALIDAVEAATARSRELGN